MDLDIQFGDLEEAGPLQQLRPDQNKHFAVAAVFEPDERDLPVYVDIDALADMEDHALSDTSVELGGVMLGGQYEDHDGRPFVLITDSLRAKHYESTKGSFKFTHDTWSQITRERDEFPEELQMVGWYHTHPDWGVFLSGMDMFICDHFFNKPLDVALVIDPCRQDRGFFQWTGDDGQRTRRTAGFFLVASRFRQQELEQFAALLEGGLEMAQDPRFRGAANYPAPVVNIAGSQPAWQTAAVLGILTMQFCFLMIISARLLWPPAADSGAATPAVQQSLDRLALAQAREERADAKLEVLERVVTSWQGRPEGALAELAEKTQQNDDLHATLLGERAVNSQLREQLGQLTEKLAASQRQSDYLGQRVEDLEKNVNQLKDQNLALTRKLEPEPAAAEDEKATADADGQTTKWTWIGIIAAVAALCLAAVAVTMINKRKEELSYEEPEERPEATNH